MWLIKVFYVFALEFRLNEKRAFLFISLCNALRQPRRDMCPSLKVPSLSLYSFSVQGSPVLFPQYTLQAYRYIRIFGLPLTLLRGGSYAFTMELGGFFGLLTIGCCLELFFWSRLLPYCGLLTLY